MWSKWETRSAAELEVQIRTAVAEPVRADSSDAECGQGFFKGYLIQFFVLNSDLLIQFFVLNKSQKNRNDVI